MTQQIRAIKNHVLFTFEQEIVKMSDGNTQSNGFQEQTDWGFKFQNFDESTKLSRWATVVSVGPKADTLIRKGSRILIDNLKWTHGLIFNGVKIWRTDDTHILAYE